jgi:hypothetical protein
MKSIIEQPILNLNSILISIASKFLDQFKFDQEVKNIKHKDLLYNTNSEINSNPYHSINISNHISEIPHKIQSMEFT